MLKKIFFFILILLTNGIFSQEQEECATRVPPGLNAQQVTSENLALYKRTNVINLRLALHIIRKSDGSQGIDPALINQMLQKLNELFTPVMFNFYVYSIDTLNSDYYANILTSDTMKMNNLKRLKNIAGCINVYFIPSMDAKGISSFSDRFYQYGYRDEQGILISNDAHITTLAHEMGHYFDLLHPFETALNPREDPDMPPLEYENIAREGDCANWWRTGDLLKDTPADPYWSGNYEINSNCNIEIIKPLPLDGCGQRNYNPLTNNIMHTSRKECRFHFTEDQKARMNETLILYRSELLKHIVYLENRYNGENAGGSLHVNDRHYPSGTFITLSSGEYRIGTDNERFPNWKNRGFTIKHNNWNGNKIDYFLSRIKRIDTSQQQIAKFEKIHY